MPRPVRTILVSSLYSRLYRKQTAEIRKKIAEREPIFKADVYDPRLNTHKLHGRLRHLWSYSIDLRHRIVFKFIGPASVLYIEVGDHAVYR